jgi:hypothetical protein
MYALRRSLPTARLLATPGTGKTTVAQRVGLLFESLGLLAGSKVVACSASDLVTGYANQAAGKTREVFNSALGQVLFIDEAYRWDGRVVCACCCAGVQLSIVARECSLTIPTLPVQAQPRHRRALHVRGGVTASWPACAAWLAAPSPQ